MSVFPYSFPLALAPAVNTGVSGVPSLVFKTSAFDHSATPPRSGDSSGSPVNRAFFLQTRLIGAGCRAAFHRVRVGQSKSSQVRFFGPSFPCLSPETTGGTHA